ncbi:hypothetical protein CTAYLR_003962 [Chrysophaeum taylorii]|uniref:tRNA-specific adenosine deaminase 1 n=1 Tax=Chrysophaeum taylorii TaxID=2483200 RepID=A0AAD7XM31_9STRA|nr:hypothetical protein CTAYLR_003962 [Chrysophaeum taylorii]
MIDGDGVARIVCAAAPADEAWTVVAGFVDDNNRSVVSVATGCKWSAGDGLRDTHAEVLARRGVVAAMWSEEEEVGSALHFYTSWPPCGDLTLPAFTGAKLFDWRREGEQDSGVPRLKAGRSDLPLHKRATSLSCSDKLVRWCVAGVEGALLSYVRGTVRIASITVGGGDVDADRFRARVAATAAMVGVPCELPVVRTTRVVPNFRTLGKSNVATVWWRGCGETEILVEGRLRGSTRKKPRYSRLATHRLFEDWFCPRFPGVASSSSVEDAKQKAPRTVSRKVAVLLRAQGRAYCGITS